MGNESERRKVEIGDKTLSIRGHKTINIRLPYSNLRLYNALFIFCLNLSLLSFSRIISDRFLAIHDHKQYIVFR